MKHKRRTLSPEAVALILDRAEEHLTSFNQWASEPKPTWAAYAHQYASAAEALVEIVEIDFCGSIGGFGPGQTEAERGTIRSRIKYLWNNIVAKAPTK